jgi:peptide subunit release factor 1 (eRF1)
MNPEIGLMMQRWRDELRTLAEAHSTEHSAITFYFQPETPQDRSHRGESIHIKDLVRDAQRKLERNGNSPKAREVLDKILRMSEELHGNHQKAKAIFAAPELGIWKEIEVPARLEKTQLHVNSRFYLKPLAASVANMPHVCVALIDREKARIFDYHMENLAEREVIVDDVPRQVKTDGFGGFKAGNIERSVDNEVMRHVKRVAERLLEIHGSGEMDHLIIGCRDESWSEVEPYLHPYLKQRLIGRFVVDPGAAKNGDIEDSVDRILSEHREAETRSAIREVLGESQRNGRGSVGLRHVLTSLERGEVHKLLIGPNFAAHAVECTNCGHLDTRVVKSCAVCGGDNQEHSDIHDVLISNALRRGVEVMYVSADEDFDMKGNIGALLRFRADQNTAEKLAS